MKKFLLFFMFLTISLSFMACKGDTVLTTENPITTNDNDTDDNGLTKMTTCRGYDDFVVIEGVCYPIQEILSNEITIHDDEVVTSFTDGIESLSDFVADLSDSSGLAIVSKDVLNLNQNITVDDMILLADETTDETENIIVKLNDEGFFEEVSFTDADGNFVEITANPLALEVYGEFTVVIFEVNRGDDYQGEFTQKLFDSFFSGGVYIIHNPTGKLFATKDVIYHEESYTYQEDHSRTVNINVTLNEPVVEIQQNPVTDEYGNFVLDEFGEIVYEEIQIPILDDEGNPVIITEGPILTEFVETQVIDYYEEVSVDEFGNPVLDEFGEPIIDIVEVPVLDEFGNPVIETIEVPVLDEFGNPVYITEFNMDFYINEIVDITVNNNYSSSSDNALTLIANRFIDQIISEYYNWSYYRVSNCLIQAYNFAYNDTAVYYMDSVEGDFGGLFDQIIKKLHFDYDTNEILIESYLDVTKSGFDQGTLVIEPINNIIIYKPWENNNIKVYSETFGLKVIPDSESLNPIIFPNGELYLFSYEQEYCEELGYYTSILYQIDSAGNLIEHYIELGERYNYATNPYYNYFSVDLYNIDNEIYMRNYGVNVLLNNGDQIFSSANLQMVEVDEFDSTRPECTDSNGCWYSTKIELYDTDENLILNFDRNGQYFPGDTPPAYIERYELNENTEYLYRQDSKEDIVICDNEIGCSNNVQLTDLSIGNDNLYISENIIFNQGDEIFNQLILPENNNAVYEYDRTITGEVCTSSTCARNIPTEYYDIEGNLFHEGDYYYEFNLDEVMPFKIEYHITESSNVTYKTEVCNAAEGCTEYAVLNDRTVWIEYEQGESMYETVYYNNTADIVNIDEKYQTSEICTNVNGCMVENILYNVVDDDQNILYQFEETKWIDYGLRCPFVVTANLSEFEINYKMDYSLVDSVCTETTCNETVHIYLVDELGNETFIGSQNYGFSSGEKIINDIKVPYDTLISSELEQVCNDTNGCHVYTHDFTIIDELGNEYEMDDGYSPSMVAFFEYGERMPMYDEFTVTLMLTDYEYSTSRMSTGEFIQRLEQAIILEDNLFLIESESWAQGDDNFIMLYNEETGRYEIKYTNMTAVIEICQFQEGYIAINDDETAILNFTFNAELSTNDYYYYDSTNLTEGELINNVNDLIVDYDGSIYFKGVDNFIQDISGYISSDGVVHIDTVLTEREIIRVRPIN